MSAYFVTETSPGMWYVQPTDSDTAAGPYFSAPEALDANDLTWDDLGDGGAFTPLSLFDPYLGRFPGGSSRAFDPYGPLDWQGLDPIPVGVTLPTITRDNFLALTRGDDYTLTIKTKVTSEGTIDGQGNTGTSVLDSVATRTHDAAKALSYQINRLKSVTYAGPASIPSSDISDGNLPRFFTRTDISTSTITPTPASPPYTVQLASGPTGINIDLFRSVASKVIQLYFLAQCGTAGGSRLYVFAPVSGTDFNSFYGLPDIPDDDPDAGLSYTEIGGDGPTLLGVTLQTWGWIETQTGEGTETYAETPTVEINES